MAQQTSKEAARIAGFLKITDLEILEHTYKNLAPLGRQDVELINRTLASWHNQQAIANLLFHPALISEKIRQDVILKALDESEMPYLVLAAVVGLESLDVRRVDQGWRTQVYRRLIQIMQDHEDVIAARASVTVWEFAGDDDYGELLRVYPVKDSIANRNIMAFVLIRFAELTKKALRKELRSLGLGWSKRRKFVRHFARFKRRQRRGDGVFMQAPSYQDIPNFEDVDQSLVAGAELETPAAPAENSGAKQVVGA